MNTLSATYCATCEWFRKLGKSFISYTEGLGRIRAAAELEKLGYYKAAKKLLNNK